MGVIGAIARRDSVSAVNTSTWPRNDEAEEVAAHGLLVETSLCQQRLAQDGQVADAAEQPAVGQSRLRSTMPRLDRARTAAPPV
jgi:hypothetical protein